VLDGEAHLEIPDLPDLGIALGRDKLAPYTPDPAPLFGWRPVQLCSDDSGSTKYCNQFSNDPFSWKTSPGGESPEDLPLAGVADPSPSAIPLHRSSPAFPCGR
jgi:hypothetical protein